MMLQRIEMCLELLKLAVKFVIVVAEAVGLVIQQNSTMSLLPGNQSLSALPYVGFFP
ncbi:hypothetical protein SLEP1_g32566 [Rubroshorea leprosula]|uniref:Uncharacterized protein n=1 Tax=Rubroshorea leprosula TaxID=152421 RepID=A0AAV5KDR2_9ROSI|nr:hypothetical protein SLEP1_g32566 [Rubroshorea leprosula]